MYMKTQTLLFFAATSLLAQIEAKYSRMSLEALQAMSGDKVPKSAAIYSARACNVGTVDEELTDARLMMMSPVPVDDQRIPVLERTRERGIRKLALARDIVGLGALGLGLFGNGDMANIAKIASAAAAGGLTLVDQRLGKRSAVPDVAGHLAEGGPRYRLAPGECRSGWYIGLFVREFTQATVRFENPKRSAIPSMWASGNSSDWEIRPSFEVRR